MSDGIFVFIMFKNYSGTGILGAKITIFGTKRDAHMIILSDFCLFGATSFTKFNV